MKQFCSWKRLLLLIVALVFVTLLAATSALASEPTGSSPNDPLMVPTAWRSIPAATTLYFYFDYSVDNSSPMGGPGGGAGGPGGGGPGGPGGPGGSNGQPTVDVTIDANGNKGLQFAIYTPAQVANWSNDSKPTPIGRGTAYRDTLKGTTAHDLYWSGGFNVSGRYLIAVTNSTSEEISFGMTVTGLTVTLYPVAAATPTPTVEVPLTVTPTLTTTIQGKIVFETETGGEIYTVNGDGTDLKLVTHGIDPAWSPDSKQITFARWDNNAPGLYIANADGSNERLLLTLPKIRWPRWSPDGKYIVFSMDKSRSDGTVVWKLGYVEVATKKLAEPKCSQLSYTPSWGADSTTIYYNDPKSGIMKTSILGTEQTLVMGPSGTYLDTSTNTLRPIAGMPQIQNTLTSSDGKSITYAQAAHDRWEVHVVNADGKNQTGVTSPDEIGYYVLGEAVHNVAPVWSADGQQILFLSNRNGKWEFFVTDPSGATVKQVLKNVTDSVSIKFGYQNERIMDWTR